MSFSIAEFFPGSELDFFPVETARRKNNLKNIVITNQKIQKKSQNWSYLISLIQFFSLSPSGFLKSHFKAKLINYISNLKKIFELGLRNLLGKVIFNGNLYLSRITKKGVKNKWVREMTTDQIV